MKSWSGSTFTRWQVSSRFLIAVTCFGDPHQRRYCFSYWYSVLFSSNFLWGWGFYYSALFVKEEKKGEEKTEPTGEGQGSCSKPELSVDLGCAHEANLLNQLYLHCKIAMIFTILLRILVFLWSLFYQCIW